MPNYIGGKNYKKTKHTNITKVPFIKREEGQHYGKVIKILGNMNMLVYCNDGHERICRIRGGIRRRVKIFVGDVVLVSYREYEVGLSVTSENMRGDILSKYENNHIEILKKNPDINKFIINTSNTLQTHKNDVNNVDCEFEFAESSQDTEIVHKNIIVPDKLNKPNKTKNMEDSKQENYVEPDSDPNAEQIIQKENDSSSESENNNQTMDEEINIDDI